MVYGIYGISFQHLTNVIKNSIIDTVGVPGTALVCKNMDIYLFLFCCSVFDKIPSDNVYFFQIL